MVDLGIAGVDNAKIIRRITPFPKRTPLRVTNIFLGCLLIGVIAALLAWKVKSMKIRIVIGIVVAVVLAAALLTALVLGGDK